MHHVIGFFLLLIGGTEEVNASFEEYDKLSLGVKFEGPDFIDDDFSKTQKKSVS